MAEDLWKKAIFRQDRVGRDMWQSVAGRVADSSCEGPSLSRSDGEAQEHEAEGSFDGRFFG